MRTCDLSTKRRAERRCTGGTRWRSREGRGSTGEPRNADFHRIRQDRHPYRGQAQADRRGGSRRRERGRIAFGRVGGRRAQRPPPGLGDRHGRTRTVDRPRQVANGHRPQKHHGARCSGAGRGRARAHRQAGAVLGTGGIGIAGGYCGGKRETGRRRSNHHGRAQGIALPRSPRRHGHPATRCGAGHGRVACPRDRAADHDLWR
ncbi:hypothetical protein D9M73_126510 [compost metagenome]